MLLASVLVAAVAGTVLFFGSDGPVTDDPAIAGRWSRDAVDLHLEPGGTYILVAGTGGAAGRECGKWRALEGTLQMRAKDVHPGAGVVLLRNPGLRAGPYRVAPPGGTLSVTLHQAMPGPGQVQSFELSPHPEHPLDDCL